LDGESLIPLFHNPTQILSRDAIYWFYPHYHTKGATPYSIIRKGKYKLIEFFADGALELYDLEKDLSESEDLSKKLPKVVSLLHQELIRWQKEVSAQMPLPNPDFDPSRALENDHAHSLKLMHTGHD
jgi:uncharacterized sulfatase